MTIIVGFSRVSPLINRHRPHDRHKRDGPAIIDRYWEDQRMGYTLAEKSWTRLMEGKRYDNVELKRKKNGQ